MKVVFKIEIQYLGRICDDDSRVERVAGDGGEVCKEGGRWVYSGVYDRIYRCGCCRVGYRYWARFDMGFIKVFEYE